MCGTSARRAPRPRPVRGRLCGQKAQARLRTRRAPDARSASVSGHESVARVVRIHAHSCASQTPNRRAKKIPTRERDRLAAGIISTTLVLYERGDALLRIARLTDY